MTGARNFFRTIGGAFGLASTFPLIVELIAVCGAILNNVLAVHLESEPDLSPELRQQIVNSSLNLPKTLTTAQLATVMNAYV